MPQFLVCKIKIKTVAVRQLLVIIKEVYMSKLISIKNSEYCRINKYCNYELLWKGILGPTKIMLLSWRSERKITTNNKQMLKATTCLSVSHFVHKQDLHSSSPPDMEDEQMPLSYRKEVKVPYCPINAQTCTIYYFNTFQITWFQPALDSVKLMEVWQLLYFSVSGICKLPFEWLSKCDSIFTMSNTYILNIKGCNLYMNPWRIYPS